MPVCFSESDCSLLTSVRVVHVFPHHARQSNSNIFFQVQKSISKSNRCPRSIPRIFLCRGVLLAVLHFLLRIIQFFSSFFVILCPSFSPYTVWSASPLNLRRIWNPVVPVHSSERLTPFASIHMSLVVFPDTFFIRV